MADAFSTPWTQHPLQNYILKTFGLFLIHRNSTTMFQNTIVDEIWFALLLWLARLVQIPVLSEYCENITHHA